MSEKNSVSITYEENESRPNIPVSGAMGGATSDGSMVVAHLYVESGTLPAMEEHDIGEGGIIDLTKGSHIKRSDLTRRVLATLVMSPETAQKLGSWLLQQAKAVKQLRPQNPE